MSNVRTLSALRLLSAGLLATVALACGSYGAKVDPVDLVLRNGKVVTMDEARPDAQAIAVKGDTIVAVGTNDEIQPYVGETTKVIDLAGQLAVPGFIESHGHFTGVGQMKMNLNLMTVKSWDEIVAMVGEAAAKAKPGEFILGRGWHQEKWDKGPTPNVEGFPTHDALSKVSPNNPVLLTHASGHATFANAKAMEVAGITRATPNPPGGEILKDPKGNPIGLLRETASGLVRKALSDARARRTPEQLQAAARREIDLAMDEVLSKGITSFQDAGSPFDTIGLLKEYAEQGKLRHRLWVMVRVTNEDLAKQLPNYRIIDLGDKHLTVRAIKKAIDGALGSRGAWLLEPYRDLPGSTGLNTTPVDEIKETARLAAQHDFQLCVHAIGDRANNETLNIFEETFKANPNKKDWRWRIEHAQHLNASDIPRFGQLGVIAAMQGIHCTSDAPFVTARLGEKRAAEGAYVWRKLLDSKATIINGTDAPVEDVDPISSFYASVTRTLKDGSLFYPDQKMTRLEALRSYTVSAAYGAFEENSKGSLMPGKLADITVLSRDILAVPDGDILKAKVVHTIVGGKVMYTRPPQTTTRRASGTRDAG
jgi:predicted amidohydrolase YtcJ